MTVRTPLIIGWIAQETHPVTRQADVRTIDT
jgi:hypothetical protein